VLQWDSFVSFPSYAYAKPWESRHGSSEACSCHWACSGTTDHCHWYNRSQPDTQGPLGLCYKLSTDCQAHQQTTFPTLDKILRTVSSLWKSHHSSKQGVELETQTRVVLAGLVSRFQTFHPKFPRPQVVTRRLCGLPHYPELQHLQGRACELRRTCRKGFNMIFFALVNLLGPICQIVGGANLIQKSRKRCKQESELGH
jgi:hypothetical protein